jgi:hypothetical protein
MGERGERHKGSKNSEGDMEIHKPREKKRNESVSHERTTHEWKE